MKVTIGIRIYPHTALARTAVREGVIDARDTLLVPRFCMVKGLEGWLRETVDGWRKKTAALGDVIHRRGLRVCAICHYPPSPETLQPAAGSFIAGRKKDESISGVGITPLRRSVLQRPF